MRMGFTLIEMLVAMTVFIVVIGSIIGLFISAIRSQSGALASQKLLDDTSYVMEYMSRAIRMAQKDDGSGTPCITSGLNYANADKNGNPIGDTWAIRFKNMYGGCQTFYLDSTNGQLKEYRTDKNGAVEISDLPLTSSGLQVFPLQFIVSGDTPGDNLQPKVTISLTIKPKTTAKPEIKIQTTLSQRNLDL